MVKSALLFGLNYLGNPDAELAGCINDAKNLQQLLLDHFDYKLSEICLCTDETAVKPTRNMILRTLKELAVWTQKNGHVDQVFISYSGHGTYVEDGSSDEKDGRDECIVPLDYNQRGSGVIRDDEITAILKLFHKDTDVIILIDACHSGTMVDMPYRYISGNKYAIENDSQFDSRIILISGCADDEKSQEVWSFNDQKKITGIMTSSFIHALKEHSFDVTCWKLIKYMNEYLKKNGYTQKPQFSTSKRLTETCIFVASESGGKFMTHKAA